MTADKLRAHKFDARDIVTRDAKRYRIVHRCAERNSMGEPRYVATILNAKRERNVVITESGLEAAE